MNASKIIVKLDYVVWREGRPRFVPGPAQRALGFKGHDLRHADGRWFMLDEALAFSTGIKAEAIQRRAGGQRKPMERPKWYSVADLFADLWRHPQFNRSNPGRMKPLAESTIRNYKTMANALMEYDAELWASPVEAVSRVTAFGLYERLYRDKGLHMARHIIATCSMAWSRGGRAGRASSNPFLRLGMETVPGRLRAASVEELRHWVAVCDAEGRPEVGDMLLFAVFTAQRQGDRLRLTWDDVKDGTFVVEQSKTNRKVRAALPAIVLARLAAAKLRRKDAKVTWPQLFIDEKANRPWKADHYRHVLADLRRAAAKSLPSIADLTDQDLRDTALTWARGGGADFETRRSLSGHSQSAAALEEKHYLAATETVGDAAVSAIMAVWEKGE